MRFDRKTPCHDCPFRKDIEPTIPFQRALEIGEGVFVQGGSFICHYSAISDVAGETIGVGPSPQHCAGAMIMMEACGEPNSMMRAAAEEGRYSKDQFKDRSMVYDSPMQMVMAHQRPRVVRP